MKILFYCVLLASLSLVCLGCSQDKQSLEVTATAYTSTRGQTDSTPRLTAWGHVLEPGVKAIAVSRDLIEMGLGNDVEVTIKGLDGTYKVLDKMNRRWNKRIDIYFGDDTRAARQWGKRKVEISW